MFKLENKTLRDFIERLIDALCDENDFRRNNDTETLNIPFIISSLVQSMKNNEKYFHEFIVDLKLYPDYTIVINNASSYYSIIDVDINLCKIISESYEDYYQDYPDYDYQIKFLLDERFYGYCQCTPDMPDYREDKHCCGHGCDADFCRFELNKVCHIISGTWHGDEHDYWDFEDEFYLKVYNSAIPLALADG